MPYEAKRRCTTIGHCNDDEVGAHGTGEDHEGQQYSTKVAGGPQGWPMQAPAPLRSQSLPSWSLARTTTRWTLKNSVRRRQKGPRPSHDWRSVCWRPWMTRSTRPWPEPWKSEVTAHDRSGKPDKTSWNAVQQVRPHHGDTLLDGGAQSVRYGGRLHDGSGQPDMLINKKRPIPKLSSWEMTLQNL